jgi:hypothetical protein
VAPLGPAARARRRHGGGHGGALVAQGRGQTRSARHGEHDHGRRIDTEAPENAARSGKGSAAAQLTQMSNCAGASAILGEIRA